MIKFLLLCLFSLTATELYAQQSLTISVREENGRKIAGINIYEGSNILAITDSAGTARLTLDPGRHQLIVSGIGFISKTTSLNIPLLQPEFRVELSPKENSLEEVVVSSTRNNQPIENSPLKVEVLGREEMDEENSIKPASIASILGDVSGVQIQQSSAASGNANVRIQGLDGRYTQILKDGMPLYEGFSGGFGVLSIPPLDLKQVELIKGSASTLYGGGAIGGLVNIISRRPSVKQDLLVTLNQSILKESNANAYVAKKYKKAGYTLYAGGTHQLAADVDKDGLSDVPDLDAWVIHPRVFLYPAEHTTIIAGYTGTFEKRLGGDMEVIHHNPDISHIYFEKNQSQRHSVELALEQLLKGSVRMELKTSASAFTRSILTNNHYFRGRQDNYFSELSFNIPVQHHHIVAGINALGDHFHKLPSDPVALDDFSNHTLGIFVQETWRMTEATTAEAGLRLDHQNDYGNFLLPRIALFHRFSTHWAARLGAGAGYKTPNPLTPQLIDYDIQSIQPLAPGLKAEHSYGYNAEFNYKKVWDEGKEFFINNAFFLTRIADPLIAAGQMNGNVVFSNANGSTTSQGFDSYIQAKLDEWELYAGYTFTIAKRNYLPGHPFVLYTPCKRMAFTIVKEIEESWRFGLEGSYNGAQYREDGSQTSGYLFTAALIEKKFGTHYSLVLNGENLFDFRQSKKEPIYTGSISDPRFKVLWAPIDGRVINLAFRFRL